jgi:hypothetical protein
MREYQVQWEDFGLNPEQLKSLGVYLDLQIEEHGCDHTLTYTKAWLELHIPKSKKIKVY